MENPFAALVTDADIDHAEEEAEELIPEVPPVYVTLLSDTQGRQEVNIAPLQANLPGAVLTVRNVLGFVGSEPGGMAEYYINNQVASLDSAVAEGDTVYVAGKLAGGK